MLQLLDLARENAALKCELARIRDEAEALKRRLVEVRQILATRRCSPSASPGPIEHCVRAQVDTMLTEARDPGFPWAGR
jgi:Mg-chelatase subunit ChlI